MSITLSPTNPVLNAPYWVCLDPIVDVAGLLGMHEQLCHAVATADYLVGYGTDMISVRVKEFLALPADHPERLRCAGMDLRQIGLYLGLVHQLTSQAERILITQKRKNPPKHPKNRFELWEPTSNTEKFRFLLNWLDDQKIFESYGRVIGLLNCPNQLVVPHVDVEPRRNPPEFIWFRISDKPFYILPHLKAPEDERLFVEGNVAWFNDSMYHAASTIKYYAISFRIDGVFTQDFRRKVYELRKP